MPQNWNKVLQDYEREWRRIFRNTDSSVNGIYGFNTVKKHETIRLNNRELKNQIKRLKAKNEELEVQNAVLTTRTTSLKEQIVKLEQKIQQLNNFNRSDILDIE